MPLVFALIAIIVALALAVVMTAEQSALEFITPGRALRLAEAGRPGSRALERLLSRIHRINAAAAFARALAYTTVTVASAWVLVHYAGWGPFMAGVIGAFVSVVSVFSIAEALPRTLAVQNSEHVALSFAPIALRITGVLYGPAKVLGMLWTFAMRLAVGEDAAHSPWVDDADYRVVHANDEQSVREENEEALLEAVSDFAEKVVREVMVPRTDMTALPDTATVAEAVTAIEEHGYSRLPIYHETVDDIRGVLYAKDLLAALQRNPGVAIPSLLRTPYFVPETKPVAELLVEMRERTHMALVADEYGGTSGLVTIEDLLEEIVGEIRDEYDRELPLVYDLGDGIAEVDARLPIDDLNEMYGTAVESDSDTVGGAVIEAAGRIPEPGDVIHIEGLRFIVIECEGTRIRKLRVEPAAQREAEEESNA
ncbi:MAG: hemolysin family protein [Coriobacteriia bacterium]